jgi:hypothetical protein
VPASFDERTNRVLVVHAESLDAAVAAHWSDFDIDKPTPLCHAILSGYPVLPPNLEAVAARYPGPLESTVATRAKGYRVGWFFYLRARVRRSGPLALRGPTRPITTNLSS